MLSQTTSRNNKNIYITLIMKIMKVMVWVVVVHEDEGQRIQKSEGDRTDAFEICCWRKIIEMSWKEQRTNESILHCESEKTGPFSFDEPLDTNILNAQNRHSVSQPILSKILIQIVLGVVQENKRAQFLNIIVPSSDR